MLIAIQQINTIYGGGEWLRFIKGNGMDHRFRELLKCAWRLAWPLLIIVSVQCVLAWWWNGASARRVIGGWWQTILFVFNLAVVFCSIGALRVATLDLFQRPELRKWAFACLLVASIWLLAPLKLGYPNFLAVVALTLAVLAVAFDQALTLKQLWKGVLPVSIWAAYTMDFENWREFFIVNRFTDSDESRWMSLDGSFLAYLIWTANLFVALMLFIHHHQKFHQQVTQPAATTDDHAQ